MRKPSFKKLSGKKKLQLAALLFFLALATPTLILIKHAFSQLKWEAFHQHQQLAEELSVRINHQLINIINKEEARSFSDYSYLVIETSDAQNFLRPSPLSKFPIDSNIPGLIGYFQIDSHNQFSTPLLPLNDKDNALDLNLDLRAQQYKQRQSLQDSIQKILSDNKLASNKQITTHNISTKIENANKPKNASPSSPNKHSLHKTAPSQNEMESADSEIVSISQSATAGAYSLANDDLIQPLEVSNEKKTEQQLPAIAAFDQLKTERDDAQAEQNTLKPNKLGRVKDLKLDTRYQRQSLNNSLEEALKNSPNVQSKRLTRKERSILPEAAQAAPTLGALAEGSLKTNIFESEIDPLEISLLDSGHLIIYRKVWRNKQRFIQGLLLQQKPFIKGIIETAHAQTTLANMSDLITAYQGNVLSVSQGIQHSLYPLSNQELTGSLLYQSRLSAPFSDFELIYSITRLPSGSGSFIITWVGLIIIFILSIGTYLMYRLSVKQMTLANQQQDFVSAVSHELKTPITSIKMYGEMLKEGWAEEKKKNSYYHFIVDESERLTRLINNILQLAHMTRNDLQVDLTPISINALLDNIQSKIASQIERSGFTLNINYDKKIDHATLNIDIDLFIQIIINLVDNAIKFSAKAENKTIEFNCRLLASNTIEFSIRDYGPGIPKNQMKKIFTLFYRSENELTRETVGTGIGLALVHQLTHTMQGRIDVLNTKPGCEFRLTFPMHKHA